MECFRPLSWGLFFNDVLHDMGLKTAGTFRPLSWGLFFND